MFINQCARKDAQKQRGNWAERCAPCLGVFRKTTSQKEHQSGCTCDLSSPVEALLTSHRNRTEWLKTGTWSQGEQQLGGKWNWALPPPDVLLKVQDAVWPFRRVEMHHWQPQAPGSGWGKGWPREAVGWSSTMLAVHHGRKSCSPF